MRRPVRLGTREPGAALRYPRRRPRRQLTFIKGVTADRAEDAHRLNFHRPIVDDPRFSPRSRRRSPAPRRKSRWPARLDWCRALSGLVLALFMWGHMFFVSSILLGKDAMWTVTRVLRGLLLLRPLVPLDRLGRRRRRDRAARRARVARGAQVPDQLPPVPRLPRPRGHDAARRHDALVLAGRHRLRAVLPRHDPPVRDAHAARAHRPVRVAPTASGATLLAALPGAAVRRRAARRHRPVPAGGQVGLVRRRRTRTPRDAA